LISVSADRFRISDGVAPYAQSWWCRSTQLPTPLLNNCGATPVKHFNAQLSAEKPPLRKSAHNKIENIGSVSSFRHTMKLYSSGSVCNSIQVPRRICGSVESVLIVAIADGCCDFTGAIAVSCGAVVVS
jgi:hypothetical protein